MKKIALIINLILGLTALQMEASIRKPIVLRYRDDNGQDRVGIIKGPVFRKIHPIEDSLNESLESIEYNSNGNAYLHEYSRREGPHEDSESLHDMYNISDEFNSEKKQNKEQDEQETQANSKVFTKHIYAHDYSESSSHSEEQIPESHVVNHKEDCETSEEHSHEETSHEDESHDEKACAEPECDKCKNKKIVYVYKQPPIYIRSKPILVQPPPLVVHQPAPKPCNPVINYKPPKISVQPVIVKIKKPKKTTTTTTTTTTSTTTTTPCPPETTTRKICKKCRRKPTRKCNRCSNKKSKDYTLYYNNKYEGILT